MKIQDWKKIINRNEKLLNHLTLVNVAALMLTTKITCTISFLLQQTIKKREEKVKKIVT